MEIETDKWKRFTKMDFKSPWDQLIDETEDLIQDCHEFERIRQLPLKQKVVLEEISKEKKEHIQLLNSQRKERIIIQKYKEFKVKFKKKWNGMEIWMK